VEFTSFGLKQGAFAVGIDHIIMRNIESIDIADSIPYYVYICKESFDD